MTQDQYEVGTLEDAKKFAIIRMAREAGGYLAELPNGDAWLFDNNQQLERFATLVAVHEREACAKVCEEFGRTVNIETWDMAGEDCATAIRARS